MTSEEAVARATPFEWLENLLRYHETGGHEGDGSDHAMRSARSELAALAAMPAQGWRDGTRVTKTKGSAWTGRVVGRYSTALTPEGYCVESENEPGSVQIYPAAALQLLPTLPEETK